MEKPITSVDELIRALGGHAETAKAFGVKPQSVYEWPERGFPGRHIPALIYKVAPAHHLVIEESFYRIEAGT